MRTFKRILSFALCLAVILSICIIPAYAVNCVDMNQNNDKQWVLVKVKVDGTEVAGATVKLTKNDNTDVIKSGTTTTSLANEAPRNKWCGRNASGAWFRGIDLGGTVKVDVTVNNLNINGVTKTVNGGSAVAVNASNSTNYCFKYKDGSQGQTYNKGWSGNTFNMTYGSAAKPGSLGWVTLGARGSDSAWGDHNGAVVEFTVNLTSDVYNLTYNANGGTINGSQTLNVPQQYNSSFKVGYNGNTQFVPTRSGYTFLGWSTSNTATSASYSNGSTYNVPRSGQSSSGTLYAVWFRNSFNVSFNGNGATSGSMANQNILTNTWANLSKNQFKQEFTVTYNANGGSVSQGSAVAKSTFNGWQDRGSIVGSDGKTYSYTAFDAPFYANINHDVQYVLCPTVSNLPTFSAANYELYKDKLGYDKIALINHYVGNGKNEGRPAVNPNGTPGTYPDGAYVKDLAVVSGTTIPTVPLYATWIPGSVTLPTPVRSGYTFNGWYTAASGGTRIGGAGDSYTPGKNVQIYAQWEAKEYYIYHSSNQSVETVSLTDTDLTAHVKGGYLYGGYYTSADFSTPYTENGKAITPAPGVTYYLKEVRSYYLQPQYFYVYDKTRDNQIVDVYLITGVDDVNYKSVGFDVVSGSIVGASSTTEVCDKFSVKNYIYNSDSGESGFTGNGITNFTFADIFGQSGANGYLFVTKASDEYAFSNVSYRPYFVTPDNVKVTGYFQRNITGSYVGTKDPLFKATFDSNYGSTTTYLSTASAAPRLFAKSAFAINTYSSNDVMLFGVTKIDNGVKSSEIVPQGDNSGKLTYAGKDGHFFAGWFNDEACTEASDFSNVQSEMTTYAKYIPQNSVSVKTIKSGLGLSNFALKSTVSVDTNQFKEIGVVYNINGTETAVAATQTQNKINAFLNVFGANRSTVEYTANLNVQGMANKTAFTVTPYWVTLDGTTVYGNSANYTYRLGMIVSK